MCSFNLINSQIKPNAHRIRSGKPLFQHGVGICTGNEFAGLTGSEFAGLTGSENCPSCTLIGNTVNLASRIQQLTKLFHWDILISEDTVDRHDGTFKMEKETPQRVKGYSKPVTVFKLCNPAQ
jgi:adenylate cyclase